MISSSKYSPEYHTDSHSMKYISPSVTKALSLVS